MANIFNFSDRSKNIPLKDILDLVGKSTDTCLLYSSNIDYIFASQDSDKIINELIQRFKGLRSTSKSYRITDSGQIIICTRCYYCDYSDYKRDIDESQIHIINNLSLTRFTERLNEFGFII